MTLPRLTPVFGALAAAAALTLTAVGCKAPSFGNQLSAVQEQRIGQRASERLEAETPVVKDPTVSAPVDAIAARVIPVASLMRTDVTIRVKELQDGGTNAYSLPGGYIYIDQGLVNLVGGDNDALAAIIAHEAAHVVMRSAAKELSDGYGNEALIDLLTQGNYEEAADTALQLNVASHSRSDEYDADVMGLKIAQQAGYDPKGLVRFLAIAQKPMANGVYIDWTTTHPITSYELRHIDQDLRNMKTGK